MKTKTKVVLTLGLLSLLALGGLTQSKYVRHATIEMDITHETDPKPTGVANPNNSNDASEWIYYRVPKNGYYAVQLRGGDGFGGSNLGGRGGVVEAVYYFTQGTELEYSAGGKAGWIYNGTYNYTGGRSDYSAGGNGTPSATAGADYQGGGGGGASALRLKTSGNLLVVAAGGGGSALQKTYRPLFTDYPPRKGGDGGSLNGAGTQVGVGGQGNRSTLGKNAYQGDLALLGSGGAGGGLNDTAKGGGTSGSYGGTGSGDGGTSLVQGVGFTVTPLTPELRGTFAAKLSTVGTSFNFIATAGSGNSLGIAGQARITFLYSEDQAEHANIPNIYK